MRVARGERAIREDSLIEKLRGARARALAGIDHAQRARKKRESAAKLEGDYLYFVDRAPRVRPTRSHNADGPDNDEARERARNTNEYATK